MRVRSIDVAQETICPRPLPFRRNRRDHEARHVGNHEAPVARPTTARFPSVGARGREGIVRQSWAFAADTRDTSEDLADVRNAADDAHVGEELELQAYPALLAGHVRGPSYSSRRTVRRARESEAFPLPPRAPAAASSCLATGGGQIPEMIPTPGTRAATTVPRGTRSTVSAFRSRPCLLAPLTVLTPARRCSGGR
jgi:hypothetical protein